MWGRHTFASLAWPLPGPLGTMRVISQTGWYSSLSKAHDFVVASACAGPQAYGKKTQQKKNGQDRQSWQLLSEEKNLSGEGGKKTQSDDTWVVRFILQNKSFVLSDIKLKGWSCLQSVRFGCSTAVCSSCSTPQLAVLFCFFNIGASWSDIENWMAVYSISWHDEYNQRWK